MSAKHDELLENVKHQEKEAKDLKKCVVAMENRAELTKADEMMQGINKLEWRSRRLNLEIHGIPVSRNEELLDKVNEVANKLGVPPLSESEVAALHRLPARPNNVPAVVLRFSRQSLRDKWFEQRQRLRQGGGNGAQDDVCILENWTKKNRALLREAKEWSKENNYNDAWHRNGKVFIRKTDGDRAVIINNANDLSKMK